jgi:hypothetical protein
MDAKSRCVQLVIHIYIFYQAIFHTTPLLLIAEVRAVASICAGVGCGGTQLKPVVLRQDADFFVIASIKCRNSLIF